MNKTFNELVTREHFDGLSAVQLSFVTTHKRILLCGNMAGQYLIELARSLKEMRDGKYYLGAGFESFEGYVEEAVGIKQRQAYNYISVVETYDEQFLEELGEWGAKHIAMQKAS